MPLAVGPAIILTHALLMSADHKQNTVTGIALSAFAFAAFSTSDAMRKYLSLDYSIIDVLFWQALLGIFLLMLFSPWLGGIKRTVGTKKLKWHVLRGLAMAANTAGALYVISQIDLAEAYVIFFLAPFVTAIMAIIFFHEKVGPYRIGAIVAGFIGGLVALRPGFNELEAGHLAAIIPILSFSAANLLAKHLGKEETRFSLGFFPLFFVLITTLILKGGTPVIPPPEDVWLFGGVGLIYTVALVSIAMSFTYAPAATVAPYQYTQFVWALFLGYVFFDEFPDAFMFLGAAIIVGAGLFLWWRENKS